MEIILLIVHIWHHLIALLKIRISVWIIDHCLLRISEVWLLGEWLLDEWFWERIHSWLKCRLIVSLLNLVLCLWLLLLLLEAVIKRFWLYVRILRLLVILIINLLIVGLLKNSNF